MLRPVDISGLLEALTKLVWVPGGDGPGQYAMIKRFSPEVEASAAPIIDECLASFPARRRGMTLFSRLIPGQYIAPHTDGHDDHCNTRIHVPLTTNPACVFVNNRSAFHMKPGWAYVINPCLEHLAINGGETDRIHLIFNGKKQ